MDAGPASEHGAPIQPSVRHVVGIGASAGGLEALELLFRQVPADLGMAFVVVQHLSPDFKSQMDELLGRWTKLRIRVAEHEMLLEPETIYLLPPNAELIVSDRRLLLKERGEGLALPIDQFLRSCANDFGDRAVAVILSGTGSDGSRGVRDVHEAGGLVIVQDEDTAKFNGMPKSAIETGVADHVVAPQEIGALLERHAHEQGAVTRATSESEEAVKLGGMRAVFALLHERYGIDFSSYKPGTISRRTERRIMLNHSQDLAEYIERLRTDRGELDALYQDLLIGVTQFFRDPGAFEVLERKVIPQLVREATRGQELRVWVAGCATGEEAYSLAILFAEAIERAGRPLSAKVFATDVHRPSLDLASAGAYPQSAVEGLSPERLRRFFSRDDDGRYRVSAELRRMIVFAPHNVARDAPFTKLDLVSCRNLLIYFQPGVQRKVLSLFHFGLRTGGLLFLGPSESPGDIGDEFETVEQHWKVYRKRRDIRLLPSLSGRSPKPGLLADVNSYRTRPAGGDSPLLEVFGQLLDTTLPPSVLLDDRNQIVHSFGDVSPLLRLPRGRPSLSLLDMLDGELKLAVAGALHRAARSRGPVSFSGVHVNHGLEDQAIDIRVTPVELPRASAPFFLVSLEGAVEAPERPAADPIDLDSVSQDRLEALEHELRHTKESLQATIEELEASNEELQATNEELLASNEELQSTNEELHSVNEELYTVNAEFQRKIDQLTELTDDMDNLLLSTEVHTLFLDENLSIRKFTPAIAEVFNLVETDVGRRIDSFVHSIDYEGLSEALRRTLDHHDRFETEVETRTGDSYFMRIVPYRGRGHRRGVVLTLIDITKIQEAEHALREQVELRDRFLAMLSHELRNPLAAVRNALTLVERRLPGAKQALAKPLAMIGRQTEHMQRLLDDLLDVSRVTQGKIHLRMATLDLSTVAHDAVEQVKPAAEERRHELSVELPEEPLWVRGDSSRLLQIIENLLTNAIKYTPEGGHIELRVDRHEKTDGEYEIRIRVRDDGAGVDEATRARIFDMFMQADSTLDRSQGGLGVGLTLVHNLVELHEGEISVRSEGLGQGSEFIVTLPCVAPPAKVQTEAEPAPAPVTGPAKVAIVEDRPEIRETLAELLRDDGFEVVTASDGLDGLRVIAEQKPQAALLDIGLPGIDGYELARQLRTKSSTAKVPLIAMTGYGRTDDRAKVSNAGFDDHLVKPVDIEDVLGALERLGLAP